MNNSLTSLYLYANGKDRYDKTDWLMIRSCIGNLWDNFENYRGENAIFYQRHHIENHSFKKYFKRIRKKKPNILYSIHKDYDYIYNSLIKWI